MLRKFALFCLGCGLFYAVPALAQFNGYYGDNGQYNQNYSPNGKPIIFLFYNNEPCDSCDEAMYNIQQAFANNWQGVYNLEMINYEEEEAQGDYTYADAYNLYAPLVMVLQDVNSNGRFTNYLKIPYDMDNFTPYTFQEVMMSEVPTFFEDYNDPYAPY